MSASTALNWPAAVVLVAGLACTAAIVITLILVTARRDAPTARQAARR